MIKQARYLGNPALELGKKPNEEVPHREKQRVVLKLLRREEDEKQHNRKKVWAAMKGIRKPLSIAQKRAGARKIV